MLHAKRIYCALRVAYALHSSLFPTTNLDLAMVPNVRSLTMAYSTLRYSTHKYERKRIRRAQSRYGKFAFLNSAQ